MLCPSCGNNVGEEIRLCDDCEAKAAAANPVDSSQVAEGEEGEAQYVEAEEYDGSAEELAPESEYPEFSDHAGYAGFWLRTSALLVDLALIGFIETVFNLLLLKPLLGSGFSALIEGSFNDSSAGSAEGVAIFLASFVSLLIIGLAFATSVGWLYYVLFETSRFQATPGKLLLNLRVLREDGAQLSFGRATARYFSKILSTAILGLGFILAGLTSKKQALHDSLASSLVVRSQVVPIWKGFAFAGVGIVLLFLNNLFAGFVDSVGSSTAPDKSVSETGAGSSIFIPVTQGNLFFDEFSVPLLSSYTIYDPLDGVLELAFFSTPLTSEDRKALSKISSFSGSPLLIPDFVLRAKVDREATVCSPSSVQPVQVIINKKPQGARVSAEFELSSSSDTEADIRCQLLDGKPLKATLSGKDTKETRDGTIEISWQLATQSRLVVPDNLRPVRFSTADAQAQVALWNPLENNLLVGFFATELSNEDRNLIRQSKSIDAIESNRPPVVLAFDLREDPEQFRAESLIKYGISFLRGSDSSVRFPGPEDEVSFYYVPTVQTTDQLRNLSGYIREGEHISGSLIHEVQKVIGGIPIKFSWALDFNTPVINSEVATPSPIAPGESPNLGAKSNREQPFAQATAGSVTIDFKESFALYYPEEKDIAIGFYSEALTDAEKAKIRENRFLWTYVNNKRPNLVIFLNLRRSSTHAEARALIDYTAYFYRDKIGSFYFPGNYDRRSFKRLSMEISEAELRTLQGALRDGGEIELDLKGSTVSKSISVPFSWDINMKVPLRQVKP